MTTANTKDSERSNIFTGLLEVKIILNKDIVVAIDTQHIHECYFVEDIFSYSITGKLTFTDDYGMYEFGPFTGNEIIAIKYGRNKLKEIVFRIVNVGKIVPRTNTSSQVSPIISLEFADIAFENFISYKFSRSYTPNQKHTDVVKHIIRNMVGWGDNRLEIIPSTSEIKETFCMPYWSPKTAISWLLSKTYTNTHYGYLCYSNSYIDHTINVKPLTYLLSSENTVESRKYNLELKSSDEDKKGLRNKILEWWVDGLNHRKTRGFRSIKAYDSDITKKRVHTIDYNFDEGLKYTPILGEYSLFDDNYSLNDNKYTNISTKSGMEDPILMKKYYTNMFVKQYSLQQLMNVIVLGNEKRYAGMQIFIDWSSLDQESRTKNRLYDGVYLVKSITHSFTSSTSSFAYNHRLTLIKNGFQHPSTRGLAKSIKRNLVGGRKSNEFEDI